MLGYAFPAAFGILVHHCRVDCNVSPEGLRTEFESKIAMAVVGWTF